jgi:deoxyadenosine/deoxycytidine kinase
VSETARQRPRFIAVEGPIGVGKTTLTRRLAQTFEAELVLEKAEDNPFLPRFYAEPARYAFATQLHFLFQRLEQIEQARQADLFQPARIADFLMDKDRLFAKVALDPAEYALYEQIYGRVAVQAPVPDLVIYLQAPVPVLLGRIERRAIDYEQRIEPEYLERLCAAYVEFFYYYDLAPTLIVNAEEINLADNDAHYRSLLEEIDKGVVGKHYFNPSVTG